LTFSIFFFNLEYISLNRNYFKKLVNVFKKAGGCKSSMKNPGYVKK